MSSQPQALLASQHLMQHIVAHIMQHISTLTTCHGGAPLTLMLLRCCCMPGASDAQLMSALTAVRGIGPWTVDMFSMFHLGRPDVLPMGDLAVRKVRQRSTAAAGSSSQWRARLPAAGIALQACSCIYV
jgi:hypothetical protein